MLTGWHLYSSNRWETSCLLCHTASVFFPQLCVYGFLWAVLLWCSIPCSCLHVLSGAEVAHVHRVLPKQTQIWAHRVRVHRHLLWGNFWSPNSLELVIPELNWISYISPGPKAAFRPQAADHWSAHQACPAYNEVPITAESKCIVQDNKVHLS